MVVEEEEERSVGGDDKVGGRERKERG